MNWRSRNRLSPTPHAAWGNGVRRYAGGALVATAGALNGNILISGQIPMVAAADGLAPRLFARRNAWGGPQAALLLSSRLSSLFLVFNYTEGLVAAFTFLIAISTLALLAPLAVAAPDYVPGPLPRCEAGLRDFAGKMRRELPLCRETSPPRPREERKVH